MITKHQLCVALLKIAAGFVSRPGNSRRLWALHLFIYLFIYLYRMRMPLLQNDRDKHSKNNNTSSV